LRVFLQRGAWSRLLLALLLSIAVCNHANADVSAGSSSLGPQNIGIVINDRDPLSLRIAEYYAVRRHIPRRNLIHTAFDPGTNLDPGAFKSVKAQVDAATPREVQAYALAWTTPFRTGCMSITTAFAAGFNAEFCAAECKPTRSSPYFNSDSRQPYTDFGWRPAMLLAGNSFEDVKALIDRGVASDYTNPHGTGYLLSTSDRQRNVRSRFYPGIQLMQGDRFRIRVIQGDRLDYRSDIMFYFTGLAHVAGLETDTFRPGAIADHLTSSGGQMHDNRQMSSLRWLEAGATGSYGTVTEPCNFVDKFPRPNIVIDRYLNGETLLEAYWKSVAWPGQGVFIGEPLARPFGTRQPAQKPPGAGGPG
jgi:uncharacterized protein (TIGR03790 family)